MRELILFVIVILLFSSCTGSMGPAGPQGPKGDPAPTPISLEGYYYLTNDSFLELVNSYDNDVYIVGAQRLVTVNFDAGLALHPKLPTGPYEINSNCFTGIYKPNYSSTTNDVEVDGLPSTNIDGKYDTIFTICLDVNNKLSINIKVFDNSQPFEILVNRTLLEE